MSVAASCGIRAAGRVPGEGEVARLYRLGLRMAEIAVIFGVSAWTVAARLDRAGVARRAPGRSSLAEASLPDHLRGGVSLRARPASAGT
jgi:hypothetical protein